MQITDIKIQARNSNRASVYVDGRFSFGLSLDQVQDLGLKIGDTYKKEDIDKLKDESRLGKVYSNALVFCLMRPRSEKELKDYLYRRTLSKLNKNGEFTSTIDKKEAQDIFDKLLSKKYIDNRTFTEYWLENRFVKKGISQRKLTIELKQKGVDDALIQEYISKNTRNDDVEIMKIINKKRSHYDDDKKLIAYLLRQGFNYEDIKNNLTTD